MFPGCSQCFHFPSLLRLCWLGDSKNTWPVKTPCNLSLSFSFRTTEGREPRQTQVHLENCRYNQEAGGQQLTRDKLLASVCF